LSSVRTNRILRTVIVSVTMLGWFALSNHCALGRMMQGAPAKKAPGCCHSEAPKPAKDDQCTHCCKWAQAVVPDSVKTAEPTALMCIIIPSLLTIEGQTSKVVLLTSGIGPPPRAASFSELVLHRSLRSHAPPFFG
jgi:hypothetical protein